MSERRRLWCSYHKMFHRECTDCVEVDYADLERQLAEAREMLGANDEAIGIALTELADQRDEAAAREVGYRKALELVGAPPDDEEGYYNAVQLRGLLALFRNEARAALAPAQGCATCQGDPHYACHQSAGCKDGTATGGICKANVPCPDCAPAQGKES